MIHWLQKEDGEGEFSSKVFCNEDMGSKDDEIAYAVEGEGEWGESIGFYINNGSVVYVGTDYLDYMENS